MIHIENLIGEYLRFHPLGATRSPETGVNPGLGRKVNYLNNGVSR
jgi:hypothetical protein